MTVVRLTHRDYGSIPVRLDRFVWLEEGQDGGSRLYLRAGLDPAVLLELDVCEAPARVARLVLAVRS